MTKDENPQKQERDFPLSWKAQTPRFPHSPPHGYCCSSSFNTQSKPQPRFVLLATFPTYPQIPRRRPQSLGESTGKISNCFNRQAKTRRLCNCGDSADRDCPAFQHEGLPRFSCWPLCALATICCCPDWGDKDRPGVHPPQRSETWCLQARGLDVEGSGKAKAIRDA